MESREFALQARIDAKVLSEWLAVGSDGKTVPDYA